jgi:predicted transcriptional regulator
MTNKFKQLLERIACGKAPGPSPTFSVLHVLHAIELIAEREIGRGKLAENLGVGKGAARTIISRLKEAGLISTSKAGCALTDYGLMHWNEYTSIFMKKVEIGKNELTLANCNFAILVKNCGHKVKSGMEQRDAALMSGADGATTVLYKDGCLVVPSVSDNAVRDYPETANQMIKLLQPEDNDVIVIGSADSLKKAEYGALAAAWTLVNNSG